MADNALNPSSAGASRISVTPTTVIIITSFNAESPYVRGLLETVPGW